MNTFGNLFRLTTFGESHGPAVGGVIDGCPAGVAIDDGFVSSELARRRHGDGHPSSDVTARCEPDRVEWLSGLLGGKTLGTPIAFQLANADCRPDDYEALRGCCRPGHADYTWDAKYGIRDHRGGGRASGRETAARVVAGAVAKQLLAAEGVSVRAEASGHTVSCLLCGVPAGLGEPVFDRFNARLAYAMLSIPSAMAFAMGDTPQAFALSREAFPDQWREGGSGPALTLTNHCGGIQGGISNGMDICFHVGFHAPSTRPDGMVCRNGDGTLRAVVPGGRHDRDHLSRLPVVVEAMAALTAIDFLLAASPAVSRRP